MEDLLSSYAKLWDSRDRRVDGLPLMSSPLPTAAVCLGYVVAVKVWGPWYMRDRKPMDIKVRRVKWADLRAFCLSKFSFFAIFF